MKGWGCVNEIAWVSDHFDWEGWCATGGDDTNQRKLVRITGILHCMEPKRTFPCDSMRKQECEGEPNESGKSHTGKWWKVRGLLRLSSHHDCESGWGRTLVTKSGKNSKTKRELRKVFNELHSVYNSALSLQRILLKYSYTQSQHRINRAVIWQSIQSAHCENSSHPPTRQLLVRNAMLFDNSVLGNSHRESNHVLVEVTYISSLVGSSQSSKCKKDET